MVQMHPGLSNEMGFLGGVIRTAWAVKCLFIVRGSISQSEHLKRHIKRRCKKLVAKREARKLPFSKCHVFTDLTHPKTYSNSSVYFYYLLLFF